MNSYLGMDFSKSASSKVQDVLMLAIKFLDQHEDVDKAHISFTDGGSLGLNPKWNIRLFEGEKEVWENVGSANAGETLGSVSSKILGPIAESFFS